MSRKFKSKRSRLPQSTKGRGCEVIYYAKSEVPDLESNLLYSGVGVGEGVIYDIQLEGNFLCEIRSA